MSTELKTGYTFAMIKSDAVSRGSVIDILNRITSRGFSIEGIRQHKLCDTELNAFYHEHIDKPYYPDLHYSVTSTPVILLALSKQVVDPDTVPAEFRKLLGSTDSSVAELGTLRAEFGGHRFRPNAPRADNAVHGSDGSKAATFELAMFFGRTFVS